MFGFLNEEHTNTTWLAAFILLAINPQNTSPSNPATDTMKQLEESDEEDEAQPEKVPVKEISWNIPEISSTGRDKHPG